ncbi:MAG: hypothetical protein GY866_26385 [Proteobacteria bacterium]|nr:hypothetical protein [Pseudomonadota bacterium]
MRGLFHGGLRTAVVSPHGDYLAGPLPEGEGMAVAEIDLKSIVRQKNTLDTVGHYARPDILQLKLDNTPRDVMEETDAAGFYGKLGSGSHENKKGFKPNPINAVVVLRDPYKEENLNVKTMVVLTNGSVSKPLDASAVFSPDSTSFFYGHLPVQASLKRIFRSILE